MTADRSSGGTDSPIAGAALLQRLGRLGIRAVFTNSGTDFPPIIEGLESAPAGVDLPDVYLVAHEHVAMGMAHGAYFATGEPQAVLLHTNVGLANAAIGAINAATDHVPVIMMSGRTPTVEQDRFGARTVPIGWGQEMRDQTALVREASKWDYELRFPEQVPSLIDRAHAVAMSTPRGPVYLSLPREVLCEPCPQELVDAPFEMAPAVVEATRAQLDEAAAILAGAERPLIIAQRGAGTQAGFDALARLAQDWAVPVCQYWAVATAISSDHPMYVGPDPEPWISDADVVLVLDSLAPWSPDIHRPPSTCRVVQIGPNPLYSRFPVRNFRSNLSITSELGPALVGLEAALAEQGDPPGGRIGARRARIADYTTERRQRLAEAAVLEDDAPMTKAWVARRIADAVGERRATVLSELGCPLDHLGLLHHDSWRQEPHSGGLGWSLPCAMGMKLADPSRLVVATMGDGSYMFANPVACHQVAEANDIAVLTVIVNNGRYGAVRRSVTDLYPDGEASRRKEVALTSLEPSPDFAMVARASRAYAETVVASEELPGALERALDAVCADQCQAVLDVHVAD